MDYQVTAATTPTRLRERVGYDREAVHAVLDEALLCHVGFVVDGTPVVLPQLHARVGEELLLHGSTGARALRAARTGGLDVCVTVTLVDGLVLARSAFHHSINYRSVVVIGRAVEVVGEGAKQQALRALVDAVVPGRSDHVRGPSRRELAATTVLSVSLAQSSVKTRSGPPGDDAEDLGLPFWAGVLPVSGPAPGRPEPAPDLAAGIEVPAHVRGWSRPGGGVSSR
ncbi:nitroimidazol reductase NimA-like FMN-containing flavoprotein (pyridoxamine 5'-phosphate oxidase superfamily) [Friedmanniella endophytica]|uniref:Nitroimidazol reductase NimA-like FMN-containing flavoprotein (Pyridoxamine 5'-phosphate oxidase superfamily) n=1 Tax=Microlunatus kandeliicorticis TaxID=1759536 RepID=A0A7W3P488_9ACTN|nr:pyridoxamine 5'-phosphate oxidase family protein [Microlunatus kandeliicorticis]MBA8792613.1 nitroimidazol reductase NimA-like FMN-containing flavoprotein (pyridoxamine 5'-phosphate oxidase superfamily) [Microlunatus kandeliicorticis]